MPRLFPWHRLAMDPARRRQTLFCLSLLLIFGIGFAMMTDLLYTTGFTLWKLGVLGLFALLFGPVAYGAGVSIAGYCVLRSERDAFKITANLNFPSSGGVLPSTAIVMPVFNEDEGRVFQAVKVMYEALSKDTQGDAFDFFVLSDSSDLNHWINEEEAWLDVCKRVKGFGRIFYRKRKVTLNKKSGNVADFCRRWGATYRYMIVLDADSVMTANSLISLVRLMEQNRNVGIIQTVPQLVMGRSLFSRIQQFAARVYGPLFSAGSSYWHLGSGSYWGHNAIIRVKPFMEHCALPGLPSTSSLGGMILSHDTVEAAFMRAAGYGVWLAYDLGGSYEEGPPDLEAALQRDRRWCHGNLQHFQLLLKRNLATASRIHLLMGILSYACSPAWLLFIAVTMFQPLSGTMPTPPIDGGSAVTHPVSVQAGVLFSYVMLTLFLPKILGVLLALKNSDKVSAFRARTELMTSVLGETLFSIVMAPILMVAYTRFIVSTLTGWRAKWGRQNRGEERPKWSELLRSHGLESLAALVVFVGLLAIAPNKALWLSPVLIGLIVSIPFIRLTSSVEFGQEAKQSGLFLIPEEIEPPVELQRIMEKRPSGRAPVFDQPRYARHFGLLQAVLDPYIHAVHVSLLRLRGTVNDHKRQYLEEVSKKLLAEGPDALTIEERNALLWDADALMDLHRELWMSSDNLHAWWRFALEHYNDTKTLVVGEQAA